MFRSASIASDVAASALVGASNVIGTAMTYSLMDKQGRKSLLITSFTGMVASMLLLSLSLSWKALAQYSGTLAVLGTILYVILQVSWFAIFPKIAGQMSFECLLSALDH